MSLWILQVSDLHFGHSAGHLRADAALDAVVRAAAGVIADRPAPLLVALCGDIVNQGDSSYYDTAAHFLERHLLQPLGMPDVACCPGNHDVVSGENGDFSTFNRFAFRITNKSGLSFDRSRTVCAVTIHGYSVVLANSMYRGHEDRKRGEIDVKHLNHAMVSLDQSVPRLVITHHSLISDNPLDPSSIANAYPVLRALTGASTIAALHGHMHAQTVLTVGKCGMAIVGVGSLLYKPYPNYNNGFNMLRLEGTSLAETYAFRYIADSVIGPTVGTFERTTLPIL